MGCFLKQKIEEILINMKTYQLCNNIAEVSQGSATVENVCGVVDLSAAPYYGLTLNTDDSLISPLNIVDKANNLYQWISLVGKTVVLKRILVVIEKFHLKRNNSERHFTSLVVKWEDVQLIDTNISCGLNSVEEDELPIETVANSTNEINFLDQRNRLIMVHNAATPFLIDGTAYCLVFISYVNIRKSQEKLWLILQGKQVAWWEFLVPNREYVIKLPSNHYEDYFERFGKPLNKAFPKLIRGISVILHHKEIFHTLRSAELPRESRLFLTPNTGFSNYVKKFARDPFSPWFSVDEADYANMELITLYGKVESVRYDEEVVHKSCYLCVSAKPAEPNLSDPRHSSVQSWVNPWLSPLVSDNTKYWELPLVKDSQNSAVTSASGVPGGMVQVIKLSDLVSGKEKCIYIKNSYAPTSLQLPRLSPGMEICMTHLNRRRSESGNVYYISTVLSTLRILYCPYDESFSEGWGTYGFRQLKPGSREKMWGVLEPFSVSKVAISARCTRCSSLFVNKHCSGDCSPGTDYTSSAHAIGRIQIIDGEKKITEKKVIIKDDQVRKLLFIPEDVWENLLIAAAEEEIICFINNNFDSLNPDPANLSKLLRVYCEVARPKCKFYISVRKMNSNPGEDSLYYCIHLEPFNKRRLNIVAEHVKSLVT